MDIVVTPPSLEPKTCRTSVQCQSSVLLLSQKSGLRLGGDTALHSSPFLERLVFALRRHHRVFPNQSPVQASQPHQPLNPLCYTTISHHPQLWRAYEPTLLTPNVVTLPSLKPTTSRTSVQHSTTKPKVGTQAWGRHCTTISRIHL